MNKNYLKKIEKLMKECIVLAKKGKGKAEPNPLVGAIIFDDDFNIISKGYHEKYGENHAERNAILNADCDLRGKSLIVNLEPCSHFGKTPPCADLIIEKGIKRVIVGMIDPNPVVEGNGIKKLKEAGIDVITNILEKECRELNEIFIKNQTTNMPFVTIKTATTLDGKIATKTGNSKWITDEYSRKIVHQLRNEYDAILTSSSTVIKDNPLLTCRLRNGKNPIRVILDTNLKTPPDSNVYNNDGTKTIIITGLDNQKLFFSPPPNPSPLALVSKKKINLENVMLNSFQHLTGCKYQTEQKAKKIPKQVRDDMNLNNCNEIFLDSNATLEGEGREGGNQTLDFCRNIKIIKCAVKNNHIDLQQALKLLHNEGIRSILVEAGAVLNNSFIQEKLADKFIQFIAPKILSDKEGKSFTEGYSKENMSECFNLKIVSTKKIKNDIMLVGYFV